MLHSLRYFPCWTSGDKWGAVVIGGDPIGDRYGDVAVISPVNNEVVIVGELHVAGGCSVGIIGRQRGVVIHWWVLGDLLGGFSLGRALLRPGLGNQAEGEGVFSRQIFSR
jgi:hypothetical protein